MGRTSWKCVIAAIHTPELTYASTYLPQPFPSQKRVYTSCSTLGFWCCWTGLNWCAKGNVDDGLVSCVFYDSYRYSTCRVYLDMYCSWKLVSRVNSLSRSSIRTEERCAVQRERGLRKCVEFECVEDGWGLSRRKGPRANRTHFNESLYKPWLIGLPEALWLTGLLLLRVNGTFSRELEFSYDLFGLLWRSACTVYYSRDERVRQC